MTNGPNPLSAVWSMVSARRLSKPQPSGAGTADHATLAAVLDRLRADGVRSLAGAATDLAAYRDVLSQIDPDDLTPRASLAFWLNLYNAGALHRAGQAFSHELDSVLRVPGAFSKPWATVSGESMSLDDIEHGKIRRFKDPRIHGALVCGAVSCPALRSEPFTGEALDEQLDDQMRFFLRSGGADLDREGVTLRLTRVLKWYGGDFVRPHRMPTLIPATKSQIVSAISPWLDPGVAERIAESRPKIVFAPYDWSLGCSVG